MLDEPTRGIDVGAKVEVYNLLGTACEDNKLLSSFHQELPEIVSLCDRVYVMFQGSVVENTR